MKKNIGLSLLTGILLALALPPFKTGFLAYGALIPFFLLLENKRGGEAFRWGYITGLFTAIATLFWIGWVTAPGLAGVLLVWPLYIGLYALLHTFLLGQLANFAYVVVPFLWVSIEYLQSMTELAFPWNYIGYTQSYYIPLIQYAEYTSIYGVSFWVVLLNVLFFAIWKNFTKRRIAVSAILAVILLFVGPFVHGLYVISDAPPERTIKVSLIQGNRDPNAKWNGDVYEDNFRIYSEMTKKALLEEPDLLIWPETALPFYLRSKPTFITRIHRLIDSSHTTLLTGTMDFVYFKDGSYDHFNSAMLIEPFKPSIQSYNKMKLVPFSERVPYKNYFPFNFLKTAFWDLGIGDFGLGEEMTIFNARLRRGYEKSAEDEATKADYKTGVAICFESIFPDHVRKYVNAGAEFIIIITNDAWFGKTPAPFQHTQIAVFRAIENRRSIARSANTGVSCFIDRYGRVHKATKIFTETVVTDEISLNDEITFYTRFGNLFVIYIAFASMLFVLFALIKKIIS